ncbi:MAG: DUF1573 domain-containing protein [Bacteroidales bacterium]|nr:DUF1573 domain-containing protein [Bacteroidales bacterium]
MKKGFGLMITVGMLFGGMLFAQSPQQGSLVKDENKAFFSLEKKLVDFGAITIGSSKTIKLSFTNTGKKTLVLTDVYTNCGCTTVDWPKDPFLPGKSGELKITYNPTETGPFNKTITVYTNAQNSSEAVQIEGFVAEK